MSRSGIRRTALTVSSVVVVFVGGTIGFHELLDESWTGAFYRTAVTTSLTGLDTTPGSAGAKYLTVGLILAGVAIFGSLAAQVVESLAREVTKDARKEKRRRRMIDELEDHFIICGYGRVGRRAAEEFAASGHRFVVLDLSPDAIADAREREILYLVGSGSEDDDLIRARIDRARGLIASADSDAENLYITLSARARRPDLTIVARASTREAERKLLLAGASRVVQPYSKAGTEMAQLALKPQVAAFLELVSTHAGPDLRFEELEVPDGCAQTGRTIRELRIRSTTGAVVIALRKPDGTFDVTPSPDVTIEAGDVLIVIGKEQELEALEEMFAAVTVAS
jgi:voltage-gated potassium channel